ncbi:MAG: hypothetical protein ACKO9S_09965, partial [Bacteroidota bacterium]
MNRLTPFLILFAFLFVALPSQSQNLDRFKPSFEQGKIILKMKPTARAACRQNAIDDSRMQPIFQTLGASSVKKKFP